MIKYALIAMLLPVGLMNGQPLQFGVKGAVPMSDTALFHGDESKPYLVGPSIEFRLPKGFAIEGDALYQRIGQSSNFTFGGVIPSGSSQASISGVYFNRMRGNSWQFPILAKKYFSVRSSRWQPFVSLGPSIRRVTYSYDSNQIVVNQNGPTVFKTHSENPPNWSIGGTAVAGGRLHKGRLAILPEFRFTRWAQNNGNVLSRNAANAFLGLSF
jgi:hypothetical protein